MKTASIFSLIMLSLQIQMRSVTYVSSLFASPLLLMLNETVTKISDKIIFLKKQLKN